MTTLETNKIDKLAMKARFNRAAVTYSQHDFLQKEVALRTLQQLDYLRITPGNIIDLGSGTGTGSKALAKKFKKANVFQLDIALSMLNYARGQTKLSNRWFQKKRMICGDIESLPIAEKSFDLAFSSLALQWGMQPDRCFREIRRVMNPGGLFLFSTLGPDTLRELRQSFAVISDTPHVNGFLDIHDVGNLLSSSGFSDPVLEADRITVEYDDLRSLMRDLKGIGASNVSQQRSRGLLGKHKLVKLEKEYELFRHKDKLPATYEVIIGHAWALDNLRGKGQQEHTFSLDKLRRRR
ncbi:MAG: malonyl-ACP O-methyltransferase BioC [Proteobacteria bacterium]|jgi:malonyl-CoA O-methyltransferase|nr:malonyl-ACP O-methyltransferase BioC [Pseudomonadota bacterium]MBT7246631.1 malonyl-ACP O-methyltransferase BioC [Pseudomonadota bacterium]MBT7561295.1 malonyl-ACP O-methyltransferase BioC [Pseudomonadota bacterium]